MRSKDTAEGLRRTANSGRLNILPESWELQPDQMLGRRSTPARRRLRRPARARMWPTYPLLHFNF